MIYSFRKVHLFKANIIHTAVQNLQRCYFKILVWLKTVILILYKPSHLAAQLIKNPLISRHRKTLITEEITEYRHLKWYYSFFFYTNRFREITLTYSFDCITTRTKNKPTYEMFAVQWIRTNSTWCSQIFCHYHGIGCSFVGWHVEIQTVNIIKQNKNEM